MHLEKAISSAVDRTRRNVRRRIATLWQYAYRVHYKFGQYRFSVSYVRKLVTELSGGVFGYLDSVLERHSFDEFGELI